MRKVILCVAVSLDGYIEGPKGEYDWCFNDQDYGLSAFFKRIDAILMGRKSYDLTQTMKEKNPWEGVATYVFSKTLKEVKGENVHLLSGDLNKEVETIRATQGKDIWLFGGANLTTSFINLGLVDEYLLAVHPILLGAGKPLFQDIEGRKKLKLVSHETYSTGLVSLCYQPN